MSYIITAVVLISGILLSGALVYIFEEKKYGKVREENIELRTKLNANGDLQNIIKRDFVELANEIIKKEQEDLRKQNRESLEERYNR